MARSDPHARFARQQRQMERQYAREQARVTAQQARQDVKDEKARHLAARRAEADRRTAEVRDRLKAFATLLSRSVLLPVGALDLSLLHRPLPDLPLDLGADAVAAPQPQWQQFEPPRPGLLGRSLAPQRYQRAVDEARLDFAAAQRRRDESEHARRARIAAARSRHARRTEELARAAREYNDRLVAIAAGLGDRDPLAVSQYYDLVLARIDDPQDFPTARHAAYVAESEMVVVEWDLPSFDVVPSAAEFTHVMRTDEIKPKAATVAARRRAYRSLIAAMALRAVWLVLRSDPGRDADAVSTVVFNGMIDQVEPATGQDVRRCLISLRATRVEFEAIRIDRVEPVECVRKHFAADVSEHPDELVAVVPVIEFDKADPRVIDPIDVLSEIDQRPDLLALTGYEFEHFVQNLFARMGLEVQVFQPGGDGGIDCVVYDSKAVFGGKYVIQAKRYAKTVPPSAVRDLYGAVQHEGATKGLLITTGGFGPSSYAWATGKPLHLMSGTELLGLCREYDIPARIVPRP